MIKMAKHKLCFSHMMSLSTKECSLGGKIPRAPLFLQVNRAVRKAAGVGQGLDYLYFYKT